MKSLDFLKNPKNFKERTLRQNFIFHFGNEKYMPNLDMVLKP